MFRIILCFILCLVAAYTDIKYGLIFNWLTLPSIIIGLLINHWLGLLCLFFYSTPFLLAYSKGMIGGGDVKLIAAISSLWPYGAISIILLSILFYLFFKYEKLGIYFLLSSIITICGVLCL